MSLLKPMTTNELCKLFGRTKYRVLPIVVAIFIAGLMILVQAEQFMGLSLSSTTSTLVTIMAKYFIPLVLFMVVADLFASEQSNGTIKASITRPATRFHIYLSKILATFIYSSFLFSIAIIESIVFRFIFGNVTFSGFSESLFSLLISLFPLIPVLLMAVFISQLSTGESSSVMLSVLAYAVIIAVGIIFPASYQALFSSYTGWYKMFIGSEMPVRSILNAAATLCAYAMIFSSLGYMLFEKKEY